MPNHVTNNLIFKGSNKDIQELRNAIKGVDSDGDEIEIDFNKIIPMPESMHITSGSMVDRGIAILKFTERGDDSELRRMLDYPWVKAENIKTPQQLVDHFLKEEKGNQDYLKEARIALDNIEKYGHKDWYSWSVANWGTKWNAYNISSGESSLSFDTAWSTPAQVIEKLSEMFPNIEITLEFADEDFGHNCGIVVFLAGNVIEENIPKGGSAEAYAIATEVQGGEIDDLMFRICDGENEEFIETMLHTAIKIYNVQTLVYFIEEEETDMFSETFLETVKSVLIGLEEYEHIGVIDDKINQKVGEQ
jgi:hypothetical protein